MPWKVFGNCVYKLNDDGSKGDKVACHETSDKARAHVRALYANVDDVTKELMLQLLESSSNNCAFAVTKEDDRYRIVVVSTAAIRDIEGETFTIEAIDSDIRQAKESGVYPEFRVFHSNATGIGMVEKMSRVGIFAIDEGYSYTDEFSQDVCEKMLVNNDGRWRASRGFMALNVSLKCACSAVLGITQKHMRIGFRCPACDTLHLTFKGMEDVQYTRTKTFDITVTDVPSVTMTSAAAFRHENYDDMEMKSMTNKQLKERLVAAGLDEEAVDARLATVTEAQLKEYADIPDAKLLKEFTDSSDDDEQIFVLDPEVLDGIASRVRKEVKSLLGDFQFEIGDLEVELPEDGAIVELKEDVSELKELIARLLTSDEERLKELNTSNSRNLLRIYKGSAKKKKKIATQLEDEEEDEEDEDAESNAGNPINKDTARWLKSFNEKPLSEDAIVDGQGNVFKSLTEMLQS